jgi:hypothetical protein
VFGSLGVSIKEVIQNKPEYLEIKEEVGKPEGDHPYFHPQGDCSDVFLETQFTHKSTQLKRCLVFTCCTSFAQCDISSPQKKTWYCHFPSLPALGDYSFFCVIVDLPVYPLHINRSTQHEVFSD